MTRPTAATPSADGGSVDFADQTLTWTGDLALAQVVVISYTVEVNDPDMGDKTMSNRVISDELGSTCPTIGAELGCFTLVTVLVPALDILIYLGQHHHNPGRRSRLHRHDPEHRPDSVCRCRRDREPHRCTGRRELRRRRCRD